MIIKFNPKFPPILFGMIKNHTTRKTKEKLLFIWLILLPLGLGIEFSFYLSACILTSLVLFPQFDLQLTQRIFNLQQQTENSKLIREVLRKQGRYQECLDLILKESSSSNHINGGEDEQLLYERILCEKCLNVRNEENLLASLERASQLVVEHSDKLFKKENALLTSDQKMELIDVLNEFATKVGEKSKDVKKMEKLFSQAIQFASKVVGKADPRVTVWLVNLGIFKQQELNQLKESEALYEEVLQLREQTLGKDDPLVAKWMIEMAYLLLSRPDAVNIGDKIERLCQDALSVRKKIYGNDHIEVASALNDCALMAALTAKDGDESGLVKARQLGQESLATYERVLGKDHAITQKARADWG
jgi:hypothetical protein